MSKYTLAESAVTASKIDFTTGIWWKELGRNKISSNATSITVNFTPKRFMKVYISVPGATEATVPRIRFNGDSANNYSSRRSENGAAEMVSAPASGIPLHQSIWLNCEYYELDIVNYISRVKTVYFSGMLGNTSSAGAPFRVEGSGEWANSTNDISSITFVTDTNMFNADSVVVVLGHD